jgi:hypothetical protein
MLRSQPGASKVRVVVQPLKSVPEVGLPAAS